MERERERERETQSTLFPLLAPPEGGREHHGHLRRVQDPDRRAGRPNI